MYDVLIIGAGVIGASIFRELTKYNLKVAVVEKENDVAMGTTKANSAIIHAGYDPKYQKSHTGVRRCLSSFASRRLFCTC